jgi:hypothetical protein
MNVLMVLVSAIRLVTITLGHTPALVMLVLRSTMTDCIVTVVKFHDIVSMIAIALLVIVLL